jgi:hypothetical protein
MEGDVQATVLGAGADGISRQTQAALVRFCLNNADFNDICYLRLIIVWSPGPKAPEEAARGSAFV